MKKILGISVIGFAAVILITMCKKPYNPKVIDTNANVLVVEGVINSGADSTFIKLSRTVKLSAGSSLNPETNATIMIEDDQNVTYPLKELTKGNYASAVLNLNGARKYRLRIKTSDGLIYLSDLDSPKSTPVIDSVGFKASDKGLDIYANTHDAANNTHYYRWEYEEAWKFHATYDSRYESDGTKIINRVTSIYYCYTGDVSTVILLGSSVKLTQDVIFQAPLINIESSSEKIGIRYSILVKQYALSKEAYEFWSNIKKNNETLGSIFDSQPSAPVGNIHCTTNASLPVIGYVGVGTIQKKRIFIDKSELPAWKTIIPYKCSYDTAYFANPHSPKGGPSINDVKDKLIPLPAMSLPVERAGDLGYMATEPICANCTLRGKLAPPAFWK